MVDINDVIWAFEQGEKGRMNGNILIAARYYRIATVSLPHCELPRRILLPEETNRKIDKVCDESYEQFHQMCRLLTAEQRAMLRSEEVEHRRVVNSEKNLYEWMWQDLIKYDYKMINREERHRVCPEFPKYIF